MSRVTFQENPSVRGRGDKFVILPVNVEKILESWKQSLFSFEWLNPDGSIKDLEDLRESEREKRIRVETALREKKHLDRPVLGIGIAENVEIGSGRAEFLTLAAMGAVCLAVHVPKSNVTDFDDFVEPDHDAEIIPFKRRES